MPLCYLESMGLNTLSVKPVFGRLDMRKAESEYYRFTFDRCVAWRDCLGIAMKICLGKLLWPPSRFQGPEVEELPYILRGRINWRPYSLSPDCLLIQVSFPGPGYCLGWRLSNITLLKVPGRLICLPNIGIHRGER